MNKRAKTAEQKREVIEKIYAAWVANPTERLGQLIDNTMVHYATDLFYVEDYDLVNMISKEEKIKS